MSKDSDAYNKENALIDNRYQCAKRNETKSANRIIFFGAEYPFKIVQCIQFMFDKKKDESKPPTHKYDNTLSNNNNIIIYFQYENQAIVLRQ